MQWSNRVTRVNRVNGIGDALMCLLREQASTILSQLELHWVKILDHNHIYSWILYQDPYAKRFMKDEKITKTAYIANSGGLLGLCMGFRSELSKIVIGLWNTNKIMGQTYENGKSNIVLLFQKLLLFFSFLASFLPLRSSTTVSLVFSGGWSSITI